MPVKRRRGKSRSAELSWQETISLTVGDLETSPFRSDDDRREAWEAHSADISEGINEGRRPAAWWDYESPQPRDGSMHETLQLYRMGCLFGDELEKVMAHWKDWAEKARTLHYVNGPGEILSPGWEARSHWRQWAGIPDELFTE